MSPDELQRTLNELPRLLAAWQEGSIEFQREDYDKLTALLEHSRVAREQFLQAMQIEAELRWRFGSFSQVTKALSTSEEGDVRPVASILLNELSYRGDESFCSVYDRLEHQEDKAQLWIRLYPLIRAFVLLVSPSPAVARSTVDAVCDEIASRNIVDTNVDDFQKSAFTIAREKVRNGWSNVPNNVVESLLKIVGRCFEETVRSDVAALYLSFAEFVPDHLEAKQLRLLCLRYFINLTPRKIAEYLGKAEPDVFSSLAEARLRIVKRCIDDGLLGTSSVDVPCLSQSNWLIDQRMESHSGAGPYGLDGSTTVRLQKLLELLKKSSTNRKCFAVLALLHESLYQTLSFRSLLEVSKSRKSKDVQQVVAEMVSEFENISTSPPAAVAVGRRISPYAKPAAWIGAIAASLVVAMTLGGWFRGNPPLPLAPDPMVAKQSTDPEPPREPKHKNEGGDSRSDAPPARKVVGVVTKFFNTTTLTGKDINQGMPIYENDLVRCDEGMVQINLPSGSEWVLEAPFEAVIQPNGAVTLRAGKIAGRNNSPAESLVVHTPTTTVVDVGTEFGVAVQEDSTTLVAVYDGAVDVRSEIDTGAGESLSVKANHQAMIDAEGALPDAVMPIAHDRAFVRSDEMQLRAAKQTGSREAAEKVAFYELLRVKGLLAYQGFHAGSQAEQFAIGFASPSLRGNLAPQFGSDLGDGKTYSSDALRVSNNQSFFLEFDTSKKSTIVLAGLLDNSQRLGRVEGDIWVSWRTKSSLAAGQDFKWAGLSLMNGDERAAAEPLFIGKPTDLSAYGYEAYGSDQFRRPLEGNPDSPGTKTVASDNQPHLWIVRVACQGGGKAMASIWIDVSPADVLTTQPQAQHPYDDFQIDRLRIEVSAEGSQGYWDFDEVILATNPSALLLATQQAANRNE